MKLNGENVNSDKLSRYLDDIETRLSNIEKILKVETTQEIAKEKQPESLKRKTDDHFEFEIGQVWGARAGIVVLAMGFVFLMTFPYQSIPSFLPGLIGYILTFSLLGLSHIWRKSFAYISQYLIGSGLILLYFSTMRLFFFSAQPVLPISILTTFFLAIVVLINLYISVKKDSVYLASMNILLGYITAIVSQNPFVLFSVVLAMTGIVVFLKLRFNWQFVIFLGIPLTYLSHLIWFINNPFIHDELKLIAAPQVNIIFVLMYAIVFASGNYFRKKELQENDLLITNTILNCLGCYILFLVITLTTFKSNLSLYHLLAGMVFLFVAIAFWIKEESKFSTFLYSMLGFLALSVAIIAGFNKPDYFIVLCWQSTLVVIAALWFRSKIIIVANLVIYVSIFIAYLFSADAVNGISLSFGIVALISARVINWQKHRLEIQTEFMRNIYLAGAFIAFPYALYHLVPGGYVSLSWVGIALFYYLLSIVLKNNKYRWLALNTLALTVFYVFIFGIAKFEPVTRVVSFIVLGIVLIAISLTYSRQKSKKPT